MTWQFWKRRPNPLEADGLRSIESLALGGELKAAAEQLARLRERGDDTVAVRYLEALVYHEGAAARPDPDRQQGKPGCPNCCPPAV